jgi:hypothetical protein
VTPEANREMGISRDFLGELLLYYTGITR